MLKTLIPTIKNVEKHSTKNKEYVITKDKNKA
jgi:hypothetical protein